MNTLPVNWLDDFCESKDGPFWNTSELWNSSAPIFNRCFQQITSTWIPSAFLIIFAPLHIFSIHQQFQAKSAISYNIYNVLRFVLVSVIILVNSVQFEFDSKLSGPALNVFMFTLFGYLLNVHRLNGIHASGFAWFFTFICVILNIPTLYMQFFFEHHQSLHQNPFESSLFFVHFTTIFSLFILTCFSDHNPSPTSPKECPEQRASFLSTLTLWWLNPLISHGYRNTLKVDDLWELNSEDKTENVSAKLEANWNREYEGKQIEEEKDNYWSEIKQIFRAWKILIRTFGLTYAVGTAIQLGLTLISFVHPQLLKIFLRFISDPDSTEPAWHGYLIAILFVFTSNINSIMQTQLARVKATTTIGICSALDSLIYKKSLSMDCTTRKQTSSGEVISLISSDVREVAHLIEDVNTVWITPFEIAIAMYFLWIELGHSDLVALVVIVAMVPLTFWIRKVRKASSKKMREKRRERVKIINELLSGMRVIRFYGWEMPFMQKVHAIREEELHQVRVNNYLSEIGHFVWTFSPFVVSLAAFSVYLINADQSNLDAGKVFVSLSLLGLLKGPLTSLPSLWGQLSKSSISVKRLETFLNAKMEDYVTREEDDKFAVTIENASFAWEKDQKPALSDVNLKIPKGSLTAIVGHVGSGKSSLLSAILGDMERVEGTVNVAQSESVAYVAQQAWIQNATLRNNVLFGADLDQTRFDDALSKVALLPDIAILPAGDQTEIGEKGINLSGGQKQRVALARACYSNASLFLFDDPLSAVDSHVAQHIFQKVLSSTTGCLKSQTRVLVTNNISILPEADQIVVIENGQIAESGTFHELLSKSTNFSEFVQKHQNDSGVISSTEFSADSSETPQSLPSSKPDFTKGKLIEPETNKSGGVPFSIYQKYFQTMTYTCLLLFLVFFVLKHICGTGSSIWLAMWSSENVVKSNEKQSLHKYGFLGLAQAIFYCLGSFTLVRGGLKSATALHRNLIEHMMRLPMSFFDTTPVGRILNLFSGNMMNIDFSLPNLLSGIVTCFLTVVSNILLISLQIPQFLFIVLPISLVYFFLQKYHSVTVGQLARLFYNARAPVFSQFQESITGMSTIRAFGARQRFIADCSRKIDAFFRCNFHHTLCSKWMSLRMEFIGSLIGFAVTVMIVASRDHLKGQPGYAGLLLNHSLSLQTLQYCIGMFLWLDSAVVSVERVEDYCKKETEDEWTKEDTEIPDGWPEKGEIEFVDYSVRYRKGLDLVLKDVNVQIDAGEKVGIVGRTGAGKSSLTLALFRILEADKGQVIIDGIDTTRLGLHDLRHKLAIIPQEPILFSGTIRSNLDPFGVYRDELLLETLTLCHMRQFVDSIEQGLDHTISENGANLSLGQRQLICLGRALLRRTKILILDEATAAIDLETDALIQQTIRREFADCTVLTIAHRLKTVLDSDRILVLDQGSVAEFDTPANLLANSKSMFYSLAKDANIL